MASMPQNTMRSDLVAPCGMNCAVCVRYLSLRDRPAAKQGQPLCSGCRPANKKCAFLKGSCPELRAGRLEFCFDCPRFPCPKLVSLDHRYVTRYSTSLINNLREIKQMGRERWLETEAFKWRCPYCGATFSIHDRKCCGCGRKVAADNKSPQTDQA
jgi:hypothetical protein